MVGYRQTNQKTDTGKTLTRWPVFVDHFSLHHFRERIIVSQVPVVAGRCNSCLLQKSGGRSLLNNIRSFHPPL
ncbi:hypothetical protein B6J54_26340 [Klebsiella quasipneumoniae]|nr:hypothetical protein B6I49_12450 [Klebsiella quasipneumoniae]PLI80697.1 hypothetical protein B6J54_26340 [Klebsiella quasipneumoniae]